MTAKNTTEQTVAGVWLKVNDGDVDEITLQYKAGDEGFSFAGVPSGAGAPSNTLGASWVGVGEGWERLVLADLFLGITNPKDVWILSEKYSVSVLVSHA